MIQSPEEAIGLAVDNYRTEEYRGVVTNKFIDKKGHNLKKIIVEENNKERVIMFDPIETSGVYSYFEIGDSLIKNLGSLQVRVIRNQTDTTIQMKFVEFRP
jgi:hypothetical protein